MLDRLLIAASNRCFACVNGVSRLWGGVWISSISTDDLRKLQADHAASSNPPFILVDVRTEKERAVSMIPGAITIQQYETEQSSYRDRLIIPYCTVGGRSYLYARKLAKSGIRTQNYRASILGWCHANLPLVGQNGQPTRRVHTYSSVFTVPNNYDVTVDR